MSAKIGFVYFVSVAVDRKNEVKKEGLVCRPTYEEKRLYTHEVGGETLTTIRNATGTTLPPWSTVAYHL